jgi:PAS domain S-box-containing protein
MKSFHTDVRTCAYQAPARFPLEGEGGATVTTAWEKDMKTDKLSDVEWLRSHAQLRQSQTLSGHALRTAVKTQRMLQVTERRRDEEALWESEEKCRVLSEAKEALKASEEKYRLLFVNSCDAAFIHDEQAHLLAVNPQAVALLGYTHAELMSMTVDQLKSGEESRHAALRMATVLEKGHLIFETVHRRKDGSPIATEVSARRIMWDGKPAIINICRDNTDRKRMEGEKAKYEAQCGQLQKAESLGRMAGAIAHKFNNLLGAVMGNLELAMIDLPGEVGPMENLVAAMKAASRAAEVSGQMLTYVGQPPGKHEALDLSEACRQSLPMLRSSLPKEGSLVADFASPGPTIEANPDQIKLVLTNLVTNAWEALGAGLGAVRLAVKTVTAAQIPAKRRFPLGWQPQDTLYACLEVADAGCGIAEKDIDELFDPFYTSKFTGRGLGLPVVLGVVRAHDGAVTVESEAGRGSVLRAYFPVSEAAPRQPEKAETAAKIAESGTVLLVEDEREVREMTKAMLGYLGFAVLEAEDGVEALEVFRQHEESILCVLSDLTMPRMDGWEMLAALRQLAPGIPVILASGYDQAQVMSGDHHELPQAFLGKPFGTTGLRDAIRQALESGRVPEGPVALGS